MSHGHPLAGLAHVHRVTTRVAGRSCELFVFDHHREAFTLWAWAARQGGPLTLVTLDRHMDLQSPAILPPASAPTCPVEELDAYARWRLSPKNDEHVVAALEAGSLGDVAVIARSHAPPCLDAFRPYRDRSGRVHRFAFSRTVDEVGEELLGLVRDAPRLALDLDLDCFSTLSDGHPDEV
ncbi:MAG: UPF0489 family protein, partial [Deltaproteobacteria bacterium]|nr:UPF0489 family protein [Deltaproteobacteria bacterium]